MVSNRLKWGIPADASSPDFNVEQYLAPEALELNEEGESFSLDLFIFSETDERLRPSANHSLLQFPLTAQAQHC